MKQISAKSLALAALSLGETLGRAAPATNGGISIRGDEPEMPYDPSTIAACTYWYDNDGSVSCSEIPFVFGVTREQFDYWNPIAVGCKTFPTGKSYCVEGPAPPAITTTTTRITSTASPTTTAPPGNGVATPTPIQEGMVSNCNKFDFIEGGTSCSTVLSRNSLTIAQLFAMNPAVGKDCTGMWANVYVCVATIGGGGSPTSSGPTTTKPPGNGIATPTPIQDGMVGNCNKFFFVESGTSCSTVLSKNSLTLPQLYAMNPSVNSDCSGMWANVYVCVGTTTSGTPTSTTKSTTTTKGNGISTPTPIQDGMVSNCDAFYFVSKGTSCSTVLSTNRITIDQLFAWNPAVGKDCSGMWAEVYVCVSTTTHTPPTTTRGNGVATPTPTQTGMVGNCKTFHFVQSGDTCDTIAKKYGITTANFKAWNPAVLSGCTGMWKDTYACVGLL